MRVLFLRVGSVCGLIWVLCSCTPQDQDHRIVVSVADQAMDVYYRDQFIARSPDGGKRAKSKQEYGSHGGVLKRTTF